jgi:hypothetical protein
MTNVNVVAIAVVIANAMKNKIEKETSKITAKSTLAKILKIKSGEDILHKFGVPCMSCPMAKFEIENLQIGQVCKMYGLNLKEILEELNK